MGIWTPFLPALILLTVASTGRGDLFLCGSSLRKMEEETEGSTARSVGSYLLFTHIVKFSSMKQRFLSSPAHNCTPMMPKMKKTKKQRSRTFPSMGKVSSSKFTRIRMPARGNRARKIMAKERGRWWRRRRREGKQ